MSVLSCFASGLGKVLRAPSLIFWLYLASILLAIPLTAAMRGALKESFGTSLTQRSLSEGFDLDWYGEFSQAYPRLAKTFGPTVVGFLPVLANLESLIDGTILQTDGAVVCAGLLYLLVWAFLLGGIIEEYGDGGESGLRQGFFELSAGYFFRLARLLPVSLFFYWAVFRWVAVPMYDWVERGTRDVTTELGAMTYTGFVYGIVGLLLLLGGMVLDYAKIALVLEARRSAIIALLRGFVFVFSKPLKTLGLCVSILFIALLLLTAYGLSAPGAGQTGAFTLIMAFVFSQLYLLLRIVMKLWLIASQTRLYKPAGSRILGNSLTF